METFPTLTTERLVLRQLSYSDADEIFVLRTDVLVNKYLNRQPSQNHDDAVKFIAAIITNSRSYWAISAKGNDKLIGTICLFDINEKQNTGEIGYELLTAYQKQGIMKEAASKVIEYAAQTLRLRTIYAYTHRDNQQSTNLLQSLNFIDAEHEAQDNPHLILFELALNV